MSYAIENLAATLQWNTLFLVFFISQRIMKVIQFLYNNKTHWSVDRWKLYKLTSEEDNEFL